MKFPSPYDHVLPHKISLDSSLKIPQNDIVDRFVGSLVGLATGDALGASVESRPRLYLIEHPVFDMVGGGTWGLKAGQWTDDTSMALCLASSLITRKGYDPYNQMVCYKWWYKHGYLSSTGVCFGIEDAIRNSLETFISRQRTLNQYYHYSEDRLDNLSWDEIQSRTTFDINCSSEDITENGALARLAPISLFFYQYPDIAVEYAGRSARLTHGDRKVVDACRYYGALIVAAINGEKKEDLLSSNFYESHRQWFGSTDLHPEILRVAQGSYKKTSGYDGGIRGKRYIVNALEAALWAFWSDCFSFERGVLAVINLGDDTDTTAAIYGQLAGACYGIRHLPLCWLNELYAYDLLIFVGQWLYLEGKQYNPKAQVFSSLHYASDSEKCLTWSSNDVCDWIKSLGQIYETYMDDFKRHNVNGHHLLNFVDDTALSEIGVNSVYHRQVILHGIDELKKRYLTKASSCTSDNENFYDQFDGDFVLPLNLSNNTYPNTKSCVLKPGHDKNHSKLYTQILKWLGPLSSTIVIDQIELIHNPDLYRMFLQQIKRTESRQTEEVFKPNLDKETNPKERKKVLNRLKNLTEQVRHNRSAPIVRVWHGCTRTNLSKLLSNGFAALSKLDDGWFGTAMYFTSSAEYATKYTNSNGCLIMCYVVLLNPFPVISNDAPPGVPSSDFRFYGRGNYSNYQCHYIPVAPVGDDEWDFRPPPSGVQDAPYDELAVFQQADILPQVVVHLKSQAVSSAPVGSLTTADRRFLSKE